MKKTALGILQSAQIVSLGSPIWNSQDEFEKYLKIISATIDECADRAEAYSYLSPNFIALAEELRSIIKKE